MAVTQCFRDFWAVISGLNEPTELQSLQTKVNSGLHYHKKAHLPKPYTFGGVVYGLSVAESVFSVL